MAAEDSNKDGGNDNNPPANPPANQNQNQDDKGGGDDFEFNADTFKDFVKKKNFKTTDEAVKYFTDLESNNTKLSQERDQYQKYYPYALAFSSYLKSDDDAMKRYKKWSEGQGDDEGEGGDEGEDADKKETPPKDDQARKDVGELLGIERDRVVRGFDEKYGLSQLPQEDYNKIAGEMGATLRSWGIDLRKPSTEMVKRLPKALDDAFALTQVKKAREEGKAEGLLQAVQDQRGRIPSIPSRGIDTTGDITESTLSDEEKKVAANMGLTPKEYAESKKEIVKEAS